MKFTNPFTDPMRRPRWIVWIIVGVIAFAGIFASSQILTSGTWFCNDVCHNVHEDNANQWVRSTHAKVGCVQCHYPPNMAPLAFTLDRVDKLLDIYPTLVGTYEWPMNLYSHLAATTPDEQCNQCHVMENRKVRTSPGIKIDHEAHRKAGINCAQCHNRICHPEEDYKLRIPFNKKKQNFSTMPACMRCHSLQSAANRPSEFLAPGTCSTCHTQDFDLTPKSHKARDWANPRGSSKAHASAAKAAKTYQQAQLAVWEGGISEEFYAKEPRLLARLAIGKEPVIAKVPPYWTLYECWNCHTPKFCKDCHGVDVPHASDFKATHSKRYKESDAKVCAPCHNESKDGGQAGTTCGQCHHTQWKPAKSSWVKQHPAIAKEVDTETACLSCHKERFCTSCHVNGKPATPF